MTSSFPKRAPALRLVFTLKTRVAIWPQKGTKSFLDADLHPSSPKRLRRAGRLTLFFNHRGHEETRSSYFSFPSWFSEFFVVKNILPLKVIRRPSGGLGRSKKLKIKRGKAAVPG